MKKLLSSLLVVALAATTVAHVVSCGPITFTKLLSRTIDTKVYRGSYKIPMTTWSSATTMQQDDSLILTNLQDALLATDQYNNFEGDLADAWISNESKDEWSFHIREGEHPAYWTSVANKRQKRESMIKPTDFFNSFRFIFNPKNASQAGGVWKQIIKYGEELSSFLRDIRDETKIGLFDPHFVDADPSATYYIDRAILAFNIYPEAPEMAVKRALEKDNTEDLIQESFAKGKIISSQMSSEISGVNPNDYNLTFHLLKPAPYFESMAAFLSFAPVPDIAVDYLQNPKSAGINYGLPIDKNPGYQNIWYSGAYVTNVYNPTQNIELVKNENYFNKDNVSIEKLKYSYVGNIDTSRQRFYFESGDLSEVAISSNDMAGWNRYVGSDYQNPIFDGVNLVSRPQANTYGVFFNFQAVNQGGEDGQGELDRRNKALSQRSVRNLIRYGLNRSEIGSFYSRALDNGSTLSHNIRNTWTSKNVAAHVTADGKKIDYTSYLQDEYLAKDELNNIKKDSEIGWLVDVLNKNNYELNEQQVSAWSKNYGVSDEGIHPLEDGAEPFLKNDLLGVLSFINEDRYTDGKLTEKIEPKNPELLKQYVELIGSYDENSENQKFKLLVDQTTEDLSKLGINGKVTLPWLINGATSTGINNYIKNAIRSFNRINGNNLIEMKARETSDAAAFVKQQQAGEYSLLATGWVPDYSDPFGFLHTLFIRGDLDIVTGLTKLFPDYNLSDEQKISSQADISYNDLRNRVEKFMSEAKTADKEKVEADERYKAFAQVENFAVMESVLVLPGYIQFLDEIPYLSYVNPFTRSTFASGQALYRFVGVQMVSKLWNHDVYKLKKKEWEDNGDAYRAMYPDKNGERKIVKDRDWQNS